MKNSTNQDAKQIPSQENDYQLPLVDMQQQVEQQFSIADIAEIQKEEEERIEIDAILNAPPAAETVDSLCERFFFKCPYFLINNI
jgi:hypothetical protein